ncbi:fibronectin type III domain-containing protein [Geothrix oryzisoli]|uniref:fibronectin type III domain-containing protein n=1 Tax=Geothrix oryzisoli TaxID=2922721 RepID=UPI001FAD5A34|nr:fibronectin type III domain-containing protein [Geothrix oryzisoli]
MKRAWGFALAFCLFLIGCGGGGGSSSPAAPVAPQLSATYDPAQTQITLTWTQASGNIDGYNLEFRVGSGTYTLINSSPIFSSATTVILTFKATPPELTTFDFRIYTVAGGVNGPYSNVAEIKTPLLPPTYLTATYSLADGGILITWETLSLLTDRYVLERATCDTAGAPTGAWASLSLPNPAATSFVDKAVAESQGYLYRVTAWSGTTSSTTRGPSLRAAPPPLAPTAFAGQALPGAVGLTWVNQSRTATQIQITRVASGGYGPTVLVATLPGTSTSFQDTSLPLGYYLYTISVSDGQQATTGPTLYAAPANPANAPSLTATVQTADLSVGCFALSPDGLWALGTSSPFTVLPAPWGTWPAWAPPASVYYGLKDPLRLDAQSRPHALYAIQTASATALNHAWFDGSAWITEVIAQAPLTDTLSFAGPYWLDQTGSPQALLYTAAGLRYTRKVAGAWVQEDIDPSNTLAGTWHLFLDPSGTPHVLLTTLADSREYSRNADGTWTRQILPNTMSTFVSVHFEDGVWADANTAWVFYKIPDVNNLANDALWAMQKVNGAWQQPVLLTSFPSTGISDSPSVALSPDGSRVAVAFAQKNGLFLFTQPAQGWVESLVPVPSVDSPLYKASFDGGNHLHILVKPSFFSTDLVDSHE